MATLVQCYAQAQHLCSSAERISPELVHIDNLCCSPSQSLLHQHYQGKLWPFLYCAFSTYFCIPWKKCASWQVSYKASVQHPWPGQYKRSISNWGSLFSSPVPFSQWKWVAHVCPAMLGWPSFRHSPVSVRSLWLHVFVLSTIVLRGSHSWRAGGNEKDKEIAVETKVSGSILMSVAHSLQEASGELYTPVWQDESLTGKSNLESNATKCYTK